jgi:sigma-E factor negative regulatory protein RseB
MRIKRASDCLGWLALALAVATATAADEPQDWLERMNRALSGRNYDGVFSHWQGGGRVETLRIIHRVQDGAVTERLVSLDGSRREFIRNGVEIACYLPDQRTVLVEHEPRQSLLLGGLPTFDASTSRFYEVASMKSTRLLRRNAQMIVVNPKDEFRYGYRLWIDEATAMPLKTQLCDAHGQVIEQVIFASLVMKPHIPDSEFKPEVSTEGFTWLREESAPASVQLNGGPAIWNALKLPPGFRMSARAAQVLPGSNVPVAHLVFTDGIASVSVFVESQTKSGTDQPLSGSTQVGSASAFSTVIEGHQVTAVGEVPPETVRFIVNSVKSQPQESALSAPALAPRH